jgi:MHS family proline/betaine transporter-like MFS transporter
MAVGEQVSGMAATGSRPVVAAIIGNGLEWYDFTAYSLFSVPIAKAFFPPESGLKDSLLWTLATFGVGFLMRPLGAVLIGNYADTAGRRAALTLVIMLMTLGTALIALTPSYAEIGIAAPVLLVLARLIQGFSVGGELGGSTAFLIESAPPGRRGLYASWQGASQGGSLMAAALVGLAVTGTLSADSLNGWGWRVPFLIGIAIGPYGLYLRRQISETPEFLRAKRPGTLPLTRLFRDHWSGLATCFGPMVLATVSIYVVNFYMPTYASRELGIALPNSMLTTVLAGAMTLTVIPIAGHLADRIGRRLIILVSAGIIALIAYPAYRLLVAFPLWGVMLGLQLTLTFFANTMTGAALALMAVQFPPEVRSSGLSIGYTFAIVLFGGFAPFIVAWLIEATGDKTAPSFYIVGAALIAFAIIARPAAGRQVA